MFDDVSATWWYEQDGQQAGPVTAAALHRLVVDGRVTPSHRVWKKGMGGWQPLSAVAELAAIAQAAAPAAPSPPPPAPPPLQTTVAAPSSANRPGRRPALRSAAPRSSRTRQGSGRRRRRRSRRSRSRG